MRAQCVELRALLFNQNSFFVEAVEQLAIKKLITKLAIKALGITVLLRAAWRDMGRITSINNCIQGAKMS